MASSSSSSAVLPPPSSSSSSPYTGKWEYDVFLCFRGDVRHSFMAHLREALSKEKIRFFVDTMLTVTEDIGELLNVLESTAISVVIFSEKFADSSWCLEEVDTIAQSVVQFGHKSLPVFYKVDWTAVAGDSGDYSTTIDKLGEFCADCKERCKGALRAVAHKTGRTSDAIPDDAELVKQIVEDVLKTLAAISPSIQFSNLVGMDSRVVQWDQFPATSLPSTFSPKKIFNIIINNSPIERCWELQNQLEYLVVLNLSHCEKLVTIPNLWKSSKLEHIILQGCKSLNEVPASVQSLVKLVRLDARDCENLQRIPARLNSKFLKQLLLARCPKLTRCPEVNSGELEALDLDGTPINVLPNAISKVKGGGMVSLYGENVTDFPQITSSLELLRLCHTAIREMEFDNLKTSGPPKFDRLHLVHNAKLKALPKCIWNMVSVELIVEDCPLIEGLPEILEPSNLTQLRMANCAGITDVSSCISNMKCLETLVLSKTGIKSLPSCIQELDQLSYVDLSYCESLESVPDTIHKLANLSELLLMGCISIRSLPELPPNLKILKANNCSSLQVLSSNIGNLSLQHLRLDGCPQLDKNSLGELVTNFPDRALSQHSQVGFHYSGSEIPEWSQFSPKCEGTGYHIVKLELPVDCEQLKGIAFAVVYSLDRPCGSMSILCGCFVGDEKEAEMVTYWRSSSWEFHDLDNSDRVYLWSGNTFGISNKDDNDEEEEDAWYQKYAGFTVTFVFYADVARAGFHDIKRGDVALLY
ncbi:Disease resistance protein RPV1 [Linum perenne]